MPLQREWAQLNLIFFFFFFFFLVTSLAHNNCRSSCGDLRNVSSPFRFRDDPFECGLPYMELNCQDNKTVVVIDSWGFYVQAISYENSTMHLTYPKFTNISGCLLPIHSSLGSADGFSSSRCHYDIVEWMTYVSCSRPIGNPRYIPIPCSNQETEERLYLISYAYYAYELENSCRLVTRPPFSLDYQVGASWAKIQPNFQMGFDLRMTDCIYSLRSIGSWCLRRTSTKMDFLRCCVTLGIQNIKNGGLLAAYILELFSVLVLSLWIRRFIFAPLCVLIYLIYKLRTSAFLDVVEKFLQKQRTLVPIRFTYSDIIRMTGNLNEKLGQGGFGYVYKGKLPNNSLVAIKILNDAKGNGDDFINEVSTIGRIHHVNIVKLIGFCSQGSRRALVYDFMNNGSLDKYIFSGKERCHSLGWDKLYEIALGIAHGIEYLHRGCDMRILHFDIKPHNILLDDNFVPKVSDFGLAKLYPRDFSIVSVTAARGTLGYIAPEIMSRNFGPISYKADVYSFGMMILEMVGGRKNVDPNAENSSKIYFPLWIYDRLNQGIDLEFGNLIEIEEEIARKLIIVGLWCIQMRPNDRPSMTKVVEMLQGNLDALQIPPRPFFSSPPRENIGSTSHGNDPTINGYDGTADSIVSLSE